MLSKVRKLLLTGFDSSLVAHFSRKFWIAGSNLVGAMCCFLVKGQIATYAFRGMGIIVAYNKV